MSRATLLNISLRLNSSEIYHHFKYHTNTKVNIFKENFKWKIYFISIRKKNLISKLCHEDIIYKVPLIIVHVKIADDIKNDDKDHNNFILKKIYMKLPLSNSLIDL